MSMAALSLLFLIAVLIIGFVRKVNMGFLAMGMALIIARLGGIADKTVIASFSTNLFITLVGPAFLFCMAVNNGTIDLMAKKLLRLVGRQLWCIPLMISLITFALSALGCGNVPTFAIILPLGMALAGEMKINVIAMGLIVTAACNFGCMSPISNGGIIAAGLIEQSKFAGQYSWELFAYCSVVQVVLTLAVFFVYKMWRPQVEILSIFQEKSPAFNRDQWITIIAIAAVIFAVFVYRVNIGLGAPLAAIVLCIFGVANDKASIKIMPWGTFILICGVNMLMAVIRKLGGIDLLVSGLTSVMNDGTAAPITSLTAGAMSWFSSTTGVVMPTLIPTVPGILEKFPANSYCTLVAGIIISSFFAAFSPASTGGAGIMAQYAIFSKNAREQDTNKLFIRLFLTSIVWVVISVLFAWVGVYSFLA